jgi:hypothetical protein
MNLTATDIPECWPQELSPTVVEIPKITILSITPNQISIRNAAVAEAANPGYQFRDGPLDNALHPQPG